MNTGINTVKSMSMERSVRWKWENYFTKALNVRISGSKLNMTAHAISTALNTVSSTMLLWFGAHLVMQGELTVGQLMAFNSLIGSVLSPVMNIISSWDEIQETSVAIERLNDVFDSELEETDRSGKIELKNIQGHIKFENVVFAYGGDSSPPILALRRSDRPKPR